jgi:DNA-binding CsgD family transcriptional regulator
MAQMDRAPVRARIRAGGQLIAEPASTLHGRAPDSRHGTSLLGRRAECGLLDRLIGAVRSGESRALVVRGEPGVGKTALLDYLTGQTSGCRVARAGGVRSETELAFAGLHQLCVPQLDRLEHLPVPQQEALRTAFGLSADPAPDRFLVALAVLGLLSEMAVEQPLICVMDDEQWLDRASAQVLGFAARRLAAEPVGLVFAARMPGAELVGLPELRVEGLAAVDARALLDSALTGPLDARIRDQIVAETRGNPLALLELARGVTPGELAGGFGLPGVLPLSGRIGESCRRRLDALPPASRRLLQLAAADPSGDPLLVWRAAGRLAIGAEALTPALEADLVEFGAYVRFRHPLVRSAAYRSASLEEKREMHAALAEAADPVADPDRRAWHRGQAASGPDEDTAAELEYSAGSAQARGGLAAAAAFLQRAAMLTPDPRRWAQRLLAAVRAKSDAGELDAALGLLVAAEAGPLDALQAAEVERLRGQIALCQRRGSGAARLLLSAARRLEPLDAGLAREAYLEALWAAAAWADEREMADGVREAAEAARAVPPSPGSPCAVDVLLEAFALRLTEGYAAAAPELTRALDLFLTLDFGTDEASRWLRFVGGRVSRNIALELWDFDSWHALAVGQAQFARDTGALAHLQFALDDLTSAHLLAGELATAERLMEEDRLLAEATGNPSAALNAMMLAAWRGHEVEAAKIIEATAPEAAVPGQGGLAGFADYASSVLYNGLGCHGIARDSARRAFERAQLAYGPLVVPELAEAAARTGDGALLSAALEWLSERTRVTRTEWVLGIEARVRALLSEEEAAADSYYQESIEHLSRTRVRGQLARAHLLYGEWLGRQGRRTNARDHLRTASEMLDVIGMEAFADRARRELLAVGGKARKRTVHATRGSYGVQGRASEPLTAQEVQVARLARDGLSNPEIGSRLFISTRTVQYHLNKVFTKLGVSSRTQLHRVLEG